MSTKTLEALITLENVEKTFAKTVQSNQRRLARSVLYDLLPIRQKQRHLRKHEFTALNDVSLTVRRGEAVGLVGHNGAGKTTLLKIIAGHMSADQGKVLVNGRVAELINLTAGYQKTLSGYDNIFIGGALRGKTRKEMKQRIQDVIDFSELDDFIHAPFGTYSLGMKMRLGFSVAVHSDPDVLLIDEVIGVGDLKFRNKCFGRLQELKQKTAFVLVTHSMSPIRDFCDRALVMDSGQIVFAGDSDEAANLYETSMKSGGQSAAVISANAASTGPSLLSEDTVNILSSNWTIETLGKRHDPVFQTKFEIVKPINDPKLGLLIYDEKGNAIVSLSDPNNASIKEIRQGIFDLTVTLLNLRLNPGQYSTILTVRDGAELIYRNNIATLSIPLIGGRPWGIVQTANRWDIKPA